MGFEQIDVVRWQPSAIFHHAPLRVAGTVGRQNKQKALAGECLWSESRRYTRQYRPPPTTIKRHCQTPSKTCLFLNNLSPGGFGVLRPANAHDPGLTSTDHYPTTSTHDRPLTTIPDRFLNSWRESRDIERRFPQKHGLEGLAAAGLLSHARLGVHGLSSLSKSGERLD